MIRVGCLLVLFVIGRAPAESVTPASLDQDRLAVVYTEGLTFTVPRILDPVPIERLTLWGLQGLTALDPALRVAAEDGQLRLFRENVLVVDVLAPADDAASAWGQAAAVLTAASFPVSAPIGRAGVPGVIQAFFDEMFSHVDPYSRYVPSVEAGEDRAAWAGQAGLGLTLEKRGGLIAIRTVVRDSPAAIAGLRPGDVVAAIDGQRMQGQDPAKIARLLSGPEGSRIMVSARSRDGRIRDIQMVRMVVPPETVFAQRLTDILVLRITGFSTSTASHVAASVQDALAEPHPVGGIVLDLRGNRGGLLRQAVTAADTFLPAGLVATTVGRDADSMNVWRSTEGELAENRPVIVLVDGHTASAAEILAAALADRGRAVVVGSSTVGKGWCRRSTHCPTAPNCSSPGARCWRRLAGRYRRLACCRRYAPAWGRLR